MLTDLPQDEDCWQWECNTEWDGQRADKALAHFFPDISRSKLQKWIDQDVFKLNGKKVKKNKTLHLGDCLEQSFIPEPESFHLEPEDMPLSIVYEDDALIIIDKPKGLAVHPGAGRKSGTLANALAFKFNSLSKVNGSLRPGILHRLDMDTSGLLIIAKTDIAHRKLADDLQKREIKREYVALCWGEVWPQEQSIDKPIGRDSKNRLKMSIQSRGKQALTHVKVQQYFKACSLIHCQLETGRTHQIRVHLNHIGYPVIGDELYLGGDTYLKKLEPMQRPIGNKLLSLIKSQALHAFQLTFKHPITQKEMQFQSPLPQEMSQALEYLKEHQA